MLPSELTNAADALRVVERERERHVHLDAVVVAEREPAAERLAERAVDPLRVVSAAAVARESQAGAAEVEGVRRQDEVAVILDDGDVADVGVRDAARGLAVRRARRLLLVDPQRVEHAVSRRAVENVPLR